MKSICPVLIITFSLCFVSIYCKNEPTKPEDKPAIQLSTKDASCDEIWIKLSVANLDKKNVEIQQDGKTISSIVLTTTDTIFYKSGLTPGKTYIYQAIRKPQENPIDVSNILQTRTLDTTSHNFTFQLDTLGDISFPNILGDVVIINDTLIIAVGEIFEDGIYYSAAIWNGTKWQLKPLFYDSNKIIIPIRGISPIDKDNIYLAAGSIYHWQNMSFQAQLIFSRLNLSDPDGTIEKLCVISNSAIYGVGRNGTIIHYIDGNCTEMESGTDLNLLSITGTNSNQLYTCGTIYGTGRSIVLSYDGSFWKKMMDGCYESTGFVPGQLFNTQLYGSQEGLWYDGKSTLWVAGDYIYKCKNKVWSYAEGIPQNTYEEYITTRGYIHALNGCAPNNVAFAGESSTIWHYNGNTWKSIGPTFDPASNLHWYGIHIKGQTLVVVGECNRKAAVMIMKQQ
jgi:hypothetical protein